MDTCTVCKRQLATRYIDLFVTGSEGLHVCHICEMELVNFCRSLMLQCAIARREAAKVTP